MARGRMLCREIGDSKKIGDLDPIEWAVYSFCYPFTDVEGRVETDPVTIVQRLGRFAIKNSIDVRLARAARTRLRTLGLWLDCADPEVEADQVVDFHRFNRAVRGEEALSQILPPPGYDDDEERRKWNRPTEIRDRGRPIGAMYGGRVRDARTLGPSLAYAGRTLGPAEVEGEREAEGEDEDDRAARTQPRTPRPSSSSSSFEDTDGDQPRPDPPEGPVPEQESNRLIRTWRAMHDEVNAERATRGEAPIVPAPPDLYRAQEIAQLGISFHYFQRDESLIAEWRRVARCFDEKGWTLTFRGVGKMLGQVFEGCSTPDPVIWQPREKVQEGDAKSLARLGINVARSDKLGINLGGGK